MAVGVFGDESCTESGESSNSIGLGTLEVLDEAVRFGAIGVAVDWAPMVLLSLKLELTSLAM